MIDIYTKDNCLFCIKAKKLLEQNGVSFNEYRVGTDVAPDYVRSRYPTMTTVPIIVIDGTLIGGYSELVEQVNESNGTFGMAYLRG